RRVHRPDSQGREARRPTGHTVGQVRVRDQPQHRQGIRPHLSARAARHRRRGDRMKRREFVSLLGGAAAWPLAARAQQGAIPIIGFVSAGGRGALRRHITAFQEGLKELGYLEGQNVAVEYRFAEGQSARLPVLVSELIKRQVAVLVVTGSATALAAKQATTTIPIVFSVGEDPLATGLVASLNRPGGNLTGAYQFTSGLEGKRLGLLHEVVPKASRIGALINPDFSAAQAQLRELEEAAPRL